MLKKIVHLALTDRKAFWWHVKMKMLHLGSSGVARSGFNMQGKMDVDPKSWWHNPTFVKATGGYFMPERPAGKVLALEPWDYVRRDMIILLLKSLEERGVEGDFAELGVYKGSTARLIHHYLPSRKLHLFDTFTGFDERDVSSERNATGLTTSATTFSDTNVDLVLKNIAPLNDNVRVYPGYFPQSLPPALTERTFAFVHLDADLFEPILAGLTFFYDRMAVGGFIVVHDYNSWPGANRAVREFFASKREVPLPMPDKSGSAVITKLS